MKPKTRTIVLSLPLLTISAANLARTKTAVNYVRKEPPPIITIHGNLNNIALYSQAVRLYAALAKLLKKSADNPSWGHDGFNKQQHNG